MDIRNRLDTAIEKYGSGAPPQLLLGSASAILGAVFLPAALVPIGAQAALNARISEIQRRRVDEAQAKIGEQLEAIEDEKVDKAFVESDAFYDWLYGAFDRIRLAHDAEKLEALRNVFLNGILAGQSSGPVKEIVLRRVGELSVHHVRAMRAVQQVSRPLGPEDNPGDLLNSALANKPFARIEEFRSALADLSDFEFETVLKDLIGLEILGNFYTQGSIGALGPLHRVVLSDFGSSVAKYISDPVSR